MVVGPLDQQLPADRPEDLEPVAASRKGPDAPEIGLGGTLIQRGAVAVNPDLVGTLARLHHGRVEIEDVDIRIAGEARRVDHPEEAAGLEVEVADPPVLRLAGGLPHGEHPLGHLASLLGGRQGLNLDPAHFESRIDPEVVGRNGCGDEAGGRRLKLDGADLDTADDLVFQPLVVHLHVVVGGEVSLGVVIDVEVDPPAEETGRPQIHLVVQARGPESSGASRIGGQQKCGGAPLVADPVAADLEPDLAIHRDVGVLAADPEHAAARCLERLFLRRGAVDVEQPVADRSRSAGGSPELRPTCCPTAPHGRPGRGAARSSRASAGRPARATGTAPRGGARESRFRSCRHRLPESGRPEGPQPAGPARQARVGRAPLVES